MKRVLDLTYGFTSTTGHFNSESTMIDHGLGRYIENAVAQSTNNSRAVHAQLFAEKCSGAST